jgi:two-component system, OmpR family, sensor histidine kinase MtrB
MKGRTAEEAAPEGRPGRRPRFGLRARVTAAFALGTLALALILSLLTYTLSSTYLVRQRESSAQRQAFVNARLVESGLRSDVPLPDLLDSLETPATSESVLSYQGRWFASSPLNVSHEELPAGLRDRVFSGRAVHQRFRLGGQLYEAVGIPLVHVGAHYFEVFSLAELDGTLNTLSRALVAGAAVTVLLGVGFGRWVSGQALRPLTAVGRAARSISQGRLDTRLDPAIDSDLSALTISFNGMADALEQRIERDARFASDVSHELRSPLTTLATVVELLHDRRTEFAEPMRDAIELLKAEVERFQQMVLDLLEISRLDAGVAQPELEAVRPAELVREAVGASGRGTPDRRVAGGDGMRVGVTVDDTVTDLVIRADKRRLERVVANLVQNAETHGGGLAGISLVRCGDRVRVLVDDAGPGIALAYRDRVFERFARGPDAESRRDGHGVGLGLALVAEHVRLQGGRVWVEDRPGGGARFVVELPVETP